MRPEETFICQPIRSLQTMLRVIDITAGNDSPLIPDGIYGPETMQAVSRFQQQHGIPVTGVSNQETWDSVANAYDHAVIEQNPAEDLAIMMDANTAYCKGECHPNIQVAQGMLGAMSGIINSIAPPSMSGMLDDATADSIASFQQLCALPMNGQLDKTTWKHLALQFPLAVSMGQREQN